jgi:hypothetical protein
LLAGFRRDALLIQKPNILKITAPSLRRRPLAVNGI